MMLCDSIETYLQQRKSSPKQDRETTSMTVTATAASIKVGKDVFEAGQQYALYSAIAESVEEAQPDESVSVTSTPYFNAGGDEGGAESEGGWSTVGSRRRTRGSSNIPVAAMRKARVARLGGGGGATADEAAMRGQGRCGVVATVADTNDSDTTMNKKVE